MILLDCSGSMAMNSSGGYSRYEVGAACCISVSNTLSGLDIVHEVLGFTEYYELKTYEFKKFGEKIKADHLTKRFSSSKIQLQENDDGDSVALAAGRLLQRPEKNKKLIVLSDGSPAGHFGGDGDEYLRTVCQKIEDDTPISLSAIGIQSSRVRQYYSNYQVVDDTANLDRVLLTLLKDSLM